MSTHNACFHGIIRKIICGYPLLPGAMRNKKKMFIWTPYLQLTHSFQLKSIDIFFLISLRKYILGTHFKQSPYMLIWSPVETLR